jgi:hypothetical protein
MVFHAKNWKIFWLYVILNIIRFSSFNMQGVDQPKSIDPSSLGDANFDYKCLEHVSLINIALFILKKYFLGSVFYYAYFN